MIIEEYTNRLYKLKQKDEELTKKIEYRCATLSEFAEIHRKSLRRLQKRRRMELDAVRKRNDKIRTQIGDMNKKALAAKDGHERVLKEEKMKFYEKIERLYPVFEKQLLQQHATKLRQLENEKIECNTRRKLAKELFEREQALRNLIQQKRHDLAITKVLEHNEGLERHMRRKKLEKEVKDIDMTIQTEAISTSKTKRDAIYKKLRNQSAAEEIKDTLKSVLKKTMDDSFTSFDQGNYQYDPSSSTVPIETRESQQTTKKNAEAEAKWLEHNIASSSLPKSTVDRVVERIVGEMDTVGGTDSGAQDKISKINSLHVPSPPRATDTVQLALERINLNGAENILEDKRMGEIIPTPAENARPYKSAKNGVDPPDKSSDERNGNESNPSTKPNMLPLQSLPTMQSSLIKDLDYSEILKVFNVLYQTIEDMLPEDAAKGAAEYSDTSDVAFSTCESIISRAMEGRKNLVIFNTGSLCKVLKLILEEKKEDLLPDSLFEGIVDNNKVNRHLRSKNNRGPLRLWQSWTSHIQKLVGEQKLTAPAVAGIFAPCFHPDHTNKRILRKMKAFIATLASDYPKVNTDMRPTNSSINSGSLNGMKRNGYISDAPTAKESSTPPSSLPLHKSKSNVNSSGLMRSTGIASSMAPNKGSFVQKIARQRFSVLDDDDDSFDGDRGPPNGESLIKKNADDDDDEFD